MNPLLTHTVLNNFFRYISNDLNTNTVTASPISSTVTATLTTTTITTRATHIHNNKEVTINDVSKSESNLASCAATS